MFGNKTAMRAALGSIPSHPADAALWFFVQARHAIWNRDVAAAEELVTRLETSDIPEAARFPLHSLLALARGEGAGLADRALLDRMLPIDTSRPPRRAAFNAQLRFEGFLRIGENEKAIEALRAADANSFIDVVFLERCPLVDAVRAHPTFVALYESVQLRAKRVVEALGARVSATRVSGA
jgi:serine/threonine-protein kinase